MIPGKQSIQRTQSPERKQSVKRTRERVKKLERWNANQKKSFLMKLRYASASLKRKGFDEHFINSFIEFFARESTLNAMSFKQALDEVNLHLNQLRKIQPSNFKDFYFHPNFIMVRDVPNEMLHPVFHKVKKENFEIRLHSSWVFPDGFRIHLPCFALYDKRGKAVFVLGFDESPRDQRIAVDFIQEDAKIPHYVREELGMHPQELIFIEFLRQLKEKKKLSLKGIEEQSESKFSSETNFEFHINVSDEKVFRNYAPLIDRFLELQATYEDEQYGIEVGVYRLNPKKKRVKEIFQRKNLN